MKRNCFEIKIKFFILFILCWFSVETTYGQLQKVKKNATKTVNIKFSQKQQTAISALEETINDFSIPVDEDDFQSVPQKVEVACLSILILWEFQPEKENERLKKVVSRLKSAYIENFFDKKHSRKFLRQSVRYAISIMAKMDKKTALSLTKDLIETEENLLSSQMSFDERLEVAEDLLEIDIDKSVKTAEFIVRNALPKRIIGYLSRLRELSISHHDYLLQRIFANLSAGVLYKSYQELILQSYIFKEIYIASPTSQKVDVPGFDNLAFPVGNVEVNEKTIFRNLKSSPSEIRLYLTASIAGFNKRLEQIPIQNGYQSALAYFLANKLRAYKDFPAENNQLFTGQVESLVSNLESLALNYGVTKENLAHLKFAAISVVTNHFGDSISDIAEDNINEKTDDFTKTRILENKILRSISKKEFAEAEKLIEEIKSPETYQVLTDYLNHSILADNAKNNKNQDEIDGRLKNISNPNVKILALLEITDELIKNQKQQLADDYLFEANRIISDKLETAEKPQMAVGLSVLYFKLDGKKYLNTLAETVRYLNYKPSIKTESELSKKIYCLDYKGNSIQLFSRGVVDGGISYEFGGSDIETAFTLAGKADWDTALQYAASLENKFLQAKAVQSVSRLVLKSKTSLK